MDTKKRGDKFEDEVFDYFKDLVDNNSFIVRSELCTIRKKAFYYSKEQERDIEFDVTIEVRLPGQTSPSLIFFIECKNYSHRVPVDDVQELRDRITQVSGKNAKGIIVSTEALQTSAFTFAKNTGIAFIRKFDDYQFDWELARNPTTGASTVDPAERKYLFDAVSSDDVNTGFAEFACYCSEFFSISPNKILEKLLKNHQDENKYVNIGDILNPATNNRIVACIEKKQIEYVANLILDEIGYAQGIVHVEKLSQWLKNKFNYDVLIRRPDYNHVDLLGTISFKRKIITVYSDQQVLPERARFTLCHEIGHLMLGHNAYIHSDRFTKNNIEVSENGSAISPISSINRLEWQANYFASALLLPIAQFDQAVMAALEWFDIKDRGFGKLFVDDQSCNITNYLMVLAELKYFFNVSKEATANRLLALGYLNHIRLKPGERFDRLWGRRFRNSVF